LNNNIVDEIKSRCSIVDVVGRYVTLKRAGNSHKGLCPFHNEKTPSFIVSENKQVFKCFGCGESGDVISFIMKVENLDFQTAVSKLCDMYGIDMDKFGFKNEGHKNKIFEMNREAALYFFGNLTGKANEGYAYMQKRGLDPKTITKFGIGFAENKWNGLTDHLRSKGYTDDLMYQGGLVSRSEKTGRYFDKFRNRVMFPIFNTRGKVIGFGGRDLGTGGPKYLNSPESAVFSKKHNLYGLNVTRQDIIDKDYVIVVEGYMDLVSLYRNGVTNVAATLGTALTDNQCQLIKRYTKNVVLSYDADTAGQNAAMRGLQILHENGLKARVLHVTEGKDPDDFIRQRGKDAFLELVDNALPYIEYIVSVLRKRYDLSTNEGVIDFIKELKPFINRLSPVEADIYIKKIAEDLNIYESTIRRQMENNDGDGGAIPKVRVQESDSKNVSEAYGQGNITLQKNFIRLISIDPGYISEIRQYRSEFRHPVYSRIYSVMENIYDEDSDLDMRKVDDTLSADYPHEAAALRDILDNVAIDPENGDMVLVQNIASIKKDNLKKKKKELERQIMQQEGSPNRSKEDDALLDALYVELMQIEIELQKTR